MARLVLVGDTGQLRAVEAGQPFLQLQRAGMTTVQMDEFRRQRNPKLRAAVLASRSGEPGKAVELLGSSVHEVAYDELGEAAGRTWLALAPEARDRTLLLAPTHAHRAEINGTVRAGLADEGVLRGKALTIERLVSLGMTRAEKGDVRNYREGDAVVFHQDLVNYRVRKDEALTVTGIEGDRVALRHPDGGPRRIKPAGQVRYRLDVYETRPIEIRAGDRIRWTRNDHGRGLINGERAEVAAIARGRVRLVLEDGRKVSLRADDPQLRHIDYAWSSTVRGAQGSTADGVIAVLDTSHRALTDQSTFYVEISRARDRAVVLTDNLDELVEVLEANTGERATALDAVGEPIEEDVQALARRIPQKAPLWTPGEEWAALEARARREGTVAFRADGYDALMERARTLAEQPDLPAATREVLDGLLAYDRACREGDAAAREFLGLLAAHAEARRGLEEAAGAAGRAIAGLEGYGDWRALSGRLIANGEALLAELGARAGDAGEEIRDGLGRLPALHALDDAHRAFETLRDEVTAWAAEEDTIPYYAEGHDALLESARALAAMADLPAHAREAAGEVIAGAEACERRRAETDALRAEATGLLEERGEMEAALSEVPEDQLVPYTEGADYTAWSARCEAAAERWQAMRDEADTWDPHLARLEDGKAALEADLKIGSGNCAATTRHGRSCARCTAASRNGRARRARRRSICRNGTSLPTRLGRSWRSPVFPRRRPGGPGRFWTTTAAAAGSTASSRAPRRTGRAGMRCGRRPRAVTASRSSTFRATPRSLRPSGHCTRPARRYWPTAGAPILPECRTALSAPPPRWSGWRATPCSIAASRR